MRVRVCMYVYVCVYGIPGVVEVHDEGERGSEDDLAERPERRHTHMLQLGAQPGHAPLLRAGQQLRTQETRHGGRAEPADTDACRKAWRDVCMYVWHSGPDLSQSQMTAQRKSMFSSSSPLSRSPFIAYHTYIHKHTIHTCTCEILISAEKYQSGTSLRN